MMVGMKTGRGGSQTGETMMHYDITSAFGVYLGRYAGDTPAEALDAMARDAGYDSQAEAATDVGPFEGTVTEAEVASCPE
jgi:hypothetical protein